METRTKKVFDAAAMQRKGARRIYEQIKNLSRDEQLAFWAERTRKLRELQASLRGRHGPDESGPEPPTHD